MKVCIHRGTKEIGGTCIEVAASTGERILLDLGAPLIEGDEEAPLPAVAGLNEPDPTLLALLISHAHLDHWGLVPRLGADVPLWCGAATERIIAEASWWFGRTGVRAAGHLEDRRTVKIGPFAITPYLADHSAFDAYSLLIEADGKRLFYTGDLRAHGRKGALFERLLRGGPKDVDVLLMEGTHVSVEGESVHGLESEEAVEQACVDTFSATPGLALVSTSAQNLDRLVTLYRATKRTGRDFVIDLYGASVARASGNANIPQPGFDRLRVFISPWQQRRLKDAGAFDRVEEIKPWRIFEEEIAKQPDHFVCTFSKSSAPRLDKAGALQGATLVYSLWPGYLGEPSWQWLAPFLSERGMSMVMHHASGHASVHDLRRLSEAMNPKTLVPVHTFGAEAFPEQFENVTVRSDGEWWGA